MRQHNDRQEKSLSIPAWDEKALTFRGSTQIPRSFLQEHMRTSMLIVRETHSVDRNAVEAYTFVPDVIGPYGYRLARGIHLLAGRNAFSRAPGCPSRVPCNVDASSLVTSGEGHGSRVCRFYLFVQLGVTPHPHPPPPLQFSTFCFDDIRNSLYEVCQWRCSKVLVGT